MLRELGRPVLAILSDTCGTPQRALAFTDLLDRLDQSSRLGQVVHNVKVP